MPKITGRENTTTQLHALIYSKYQKGMSPSAIATFVGYTTRTVQRLIKKYEERGHHNDGALCPSIHILTGLPWIP